MKQTWVLKDNYLFLLIQFLTFSFLIGNTKIMHAQEAQTTIWKVQSIDTVKQSRDLARERNNNIYDSVIESQVKKISETGATHVSLGTPYDEEFNRYLKKWVNFARKYRLKVWFRGNFSGWENWFEYDSITREEHIKLTQEFLNSNKELFEDGDIFTSCPECENGGPGDPRNNNDISGHIKFLIDQYNLCKDFFETNNLKVTCNYFSMNGDVARLIMDKETTKNLGGIVTIDHYVETPQQLIKDIKSLAAQSGGKIILGEFGAPIPDIHGYYSQEEQAEWVNRSLSQLVKSKEVVGINYWSHSGSSTALWNDDGTERTVLNEIKRFYKPHKFEGKIVNELGRSVTNSQIKYDDQTVTTDSQGKFLIIYLEDEKRLSITAPGYKEKVYLATPDIESEDIIIEITDANLWFRFLKFIKRVTNTLYK